VKIRSIVRITFRLLFFGAWLAVGVVAVSALFLRGSGDRMASRNMEIADGGTILHFETVAPIMAPSEPGGESEAAEQDPWAGAFGNTIGDSQGETQGMGFSGPGPGGGGTGLGTIGVGSIGSSGKGGNVKAYGSAAPVTKPTVAAAPSEVAEASVAADDEDPFSDVDRKLANLPLGNIAFNTPETIPFGDDARIELLVSLKEAEAELRQAVRAAGPVESARVKISDQMEARLTGLGFRIEAITPERQAITRGERTRWQWQIEPNKSANLGLHLTLSALIEVDGVPATRAVRTFERTIYVDVPLVHRVGDFLTGHLELLLSFVLVPVAGGVYRHVRNKRKQGEAGSNQTPPAKRAA
jgi:hypothetical protein